jgi:RHS repeat-associated protein
MGPVKNRGGEHLPCRDRTNADRLHRFTSSTEDWIGTINHNQLGEIELANNVGSDRYGWIPPLEDSSYTTNALNQYTDGDGKVMRYDRNGNLTSDGVWTYSYDLENRMKTANRSGTSATLDYDPEGRLVRTTVNGLETNLLYNGQDLVGEYDGAGKVTRRYIFSPGMDTPLAQYESNARGDSATWFYANQQGSIVALADGKGVTTGSQAYGAFGETEGTPTSRFGYTGQQYLAPLGLYYYKARMYSPALGRFLQTDPIGTKDDLNLYAYVKNNPVNFTDPTGLIASLSGGNFTTNTAAPATAPKLNAPAIGMPATAAANQAAVQVAARGVPMTGNPPGSFRLNPNGLDTDYFDGAGNLSAQYHESHGEAHGHNFFDGSRDPTHRPMSPLPR